MSPPPQRRAAPLTGDLAGMAAGVGGAESVPYSLGQWQEARLSIRSRSAPSLSSCLAQPLRESQERHCTSKERHKSGQRHEKQRQGFHPTQERTTTGRSEMVPATPPASGDALWGHRCRRRSCAEQGPNPETLSGSEHLQISFCSGSTRSL